MRKLVLNIVLFFAAFGTFCGASVIGSRYLPTLENWLWGKGSAHGSTNLRVPEFVEWSEANPSPDILFLGSSTCYRGIDPARLDAFGWASFNLCSSAQPLATSQFILDFATQHSAPKMLVLDVYEGVMNGTFYHSRRDHILSNNLVGNQAFQQMARSSGDPFLYMQAKYFAWKRKAAPLPPLWPGSTDNYVGRGFVESTREVQDIPPCKHEQTALHAENAEALNYIKERCEELEVQLVLLAPPMTCKGELYWPEEFSDFLRIDGNDWPGSKVDTMYYDDHHLRAIGAKLYSDWLGKELLKL
jgi:hypothetical protein